MTYASSIAAVLLAAGALVTAAPVTQLSVPPGTRIAVQTADVIDSDGTNLAVEYNASLADPVMAGSTVLIQKGTPAILRVVQLDNAGVRGRVSLGITLAALMLEGKRVEVRTEQATIQSDSQGAKTAKGGILGGVIGAVVGGVVGGGGGAAKGAAIGAAAGAGAAVITGVKVHVAKETRLSFKVVDPNAPAIPTAPPAPVTVEGYMVEVNACTRRNTASVTCEITVTNQKADRKLTLQGGSMVDSGGTEQPAVKLQLGNSGLSAKAAQSNVVYQKGVRLKVQFGGVTPDITHLSRVTVNFVTATPTGDVAFDAVLQDVPLPVR